MFSLKNKVAVITGGGSGIGKAITKLFAQQGATVHIIELNTEAATETAEEIKKENGNCKVHKCNVADQKEVISVFETIGKIQMLVNNAGINQKKPLTEVSDAEFQRIIHTNVNSVFSLSRETAKVMIQQKKGCIINISSMAAQYGLPQVISYSASKTAVEGMTRAMAVELSPLGIRINCIAPGFIFTKMSSTALDGDPERKQKVLSRTPMGKLGMPEDVANAAYFLASDESSFMTGAVIPVDGGNSIGF